MRKMEDWNYSIRRIIHLAYLDDANKEFQTLNPKIEEYKEKFGNILQELGFTPISFYTEFITKQHYRPSPTDGANMEEMKIWNEFLREVFIECQKLEKTLVFRVKFHQYELRNSNKYLISCWSHFNQFKKSLHQKILEHITRRHPSAIIEFPESQNPNRDTTEGVGFIVKIPISEI